MALRELTIRNFAIIKQLEIEINDHLTVVTGETGAGKSIVLQALNLLLGARAEADMVRHGEDQCEISALFDISAQQDVCDWLIERDLRSDDQSEEPYCLIRRIVRINKPTKCYINDQPTTLASLKQLGLMLVDLHGQHEHQSLLRRSTQRQILDQFAGHSKELQEMARLAAKINRLERKLNEISSNNTDNADRLELISFQLTELDEANIQPQEFTGLADDQSRLANAQQLIEGIQQAQDQLFHNDQHNVSLDLGKQINQLTELAEYDSSLTPTLEILNSALSHVEEAQSALDASLARVEQDPERLHELDQRMETIINLARKHRCSESELLERQGMLQAEYDRLKNAHLEPEKLQAELSGLAVSYADVANMVSKNRQRVAAELSKSITEQMQGLGMKGGYLEIQVEPQIADQLIVSESGIDQIEYLVSTNYGMPLKALQKTASGGELSRISLAIQVITSAHSNSPSLVFDEVDVGVGGKVAGIVGQRLADLGRNAQVICITHLPQVAARGNHHLAVDKISSNYETFSTLVNLQHEQRVEEIARMLGGTEITERTREHAREMLEQQADDIQAAS